MAAEIVFDVVMGPWVEAPDGGHRFQRCRSYELASNDTVEVLLEERHGVVAVIAAVLQRQEPEVPYGDNEWYDVALVPPSAIRLWPNTPQGRRGAARAWARRTGSASG